MRLCRNKLSRVLAALLLCAPAFPAQPEQAKRFHLAIAKGSLSSGLDQFSHQTGLQIITQPNVSESKTDELGPFVGHATVDEALTELLKESDLSYVWQDESTIRIFLTVVQPPRSDDNINGVVVTGTRLGGADGGPAPVRVLGRGRIDRYGVSSVAEFSRYLTQQPFTFSAGHLQSGAQTFQMRGLGFDTTLVLINGRRMPPSANSISLNAVDLNSIPLTAVERIEVMSDSASAIYGADAIGGVVNIILKDRIEQPELYLHYGEAAGGGAQRRAAASLGTANDQLKSTLVLDYYEATALMGEERDLWRNQDYRRFGGRDYRVSATNPGNVYSLIGQPMEGVTNLKSSFSDWSITPPATRASAYGSAEYSFGEEHSLFGEVLAERSDVAALRPPPSVSRQFVPASNPFNRFGTPVVVDYSFAGMDPISHIHETDMLRVVAGTRGRISPWDWEFTGLHHREDALITTRGRLDPSRVSAAINSDDPQTALNVFSNGPGGTPGLLGSLIGDPQSFSFSFSSSQLSAFIRGPVFDVGERTAELVVGGEWRHDAAGFVESGKRADVARDIASVFSEVRVPLFDNMSLQIAARGDDYGAGKQTVNPQYGLSWRPAIDWLFRAAYGTSFRPPSLFELHMPMFEPSLVIADPLRGGEVTNVAISVGGNPDLEVVTARSFTAGFVFTPAEMPHLRLGGNYWRVVMDSRIMAPNYQELLKPESELSDRVVRDPPGEQDVQAGWAGRLRSIDLTRVNYGDLATSGIDLDASFLVESYWGCINLNLAVTWVNEYLSRDMSQALPLNRVGIANAAGTIPEWRLVGTVGWKLGDFGWSTTTTFTPSYQDADVWTGPLDRRIGSQILMDLQAWMDLNREGSVLLDGTTLTIGARNVFDRAPEFANAGAALGYDFSQSDLTRRFIYLRLSRRF